MIVRLGSQLEHKSDGIQASSQSLPLRQWPVDLDALPLENRLGRACQCTGALVVDTLHAKIYVHSPVPPPRSICICICAYTQSDPRPCTSLKATDNDRRPTRMHPTKRGNFYVCTCTCTYNFFFLQNFVSGLKTYTGTPGLYSLSLSLSLRLSLLFSKPKLHSHTHGAKSVLTPIPPELHAYGQPASRQEQRVHFSASPLIPSHSFSLLPSHLPLPSPSLLTSHFRVLPSLSVYMYIRLRIRV